MSKQCGCGHCQPSWFEQGWCCSKASDDCADVATVVQDEGPQTGVAQRKGDAMHISVPQHIVGSLMGKGGKTVQWLQEETKCRIQLVDQFNGDGCMKTSRLVTMRSKSSIPSDQETSLELCAYVVEALCAKPDAQLEQVLANGKNLLREREEVILLAQQQEREAQIEEQQEGAVRQLMRSMGDLFSETAIRDALSKEQWYVDQAEERLLQEGSRVPAPARVSTTVSEAKPNRFNTVRKPIPQSLERTDEPVPSRAVMLMRAVCEKARARDAECYPGAKHSTEQSSQQGRNHQHTNCTRSSRAPATNARRVTTARRC